MKPIVKWFFVLILLTSACSQQPAQVVVNTPTIQPQPTITPSTTIVPSETPSPTATNTSVPSPTGTPFPIKGVELRDGRPAHFANENPELPVGYFYRSFLQKPADITWGPDHFMYIADKDGRHIVRVAKDGTVDDTYTWHYSHMWNQNGPTGITFAPDGTQYFSNTEHVTHLGADGWPTIVTNELIVSSIGKLAFSPWGNLYFTRLDENGAIYWLDEKNTTHFLTDGLGYPNDLVFDERGRLYISLNWQGEIVTVNTEIGNIHTFYDEEGNGEIYLAVDPEGDLWVRSDDRILQLSQLGEIKPFVLDGISYGRIQPENGYDWGQSAGIAFDDEGGLWVASSNSKVIRLVPDDPGDTDPEFSSQVMLPGFDPSDAEIGVDGLVYTYNMNTQELWRMKEDGLIEVMLTYPTPGAVLIAINKLGDLYLGTPDGQIVRVEENGMLAQIASLQAFSMQFDSNGILYVASKDPNGKNLLFKLTTENTVESIPEKTDVYNLGSGEILLSTKPEAGLYIYLETEQTVLLIDENGSIQFLRDFNFMGSFGDTIFTAAPGDQFYFVAKDKGKLYKGFDSPNENTLTIARGYGGSFLRDILVSLDGSWIWVFESGAIGQLARQ